MNPQPKSNRRKPREIRVGDTVQFTEKTANAFLAVAAKEGVKTFKVLETVDSELYPFRIDFMGYNPRGTLVRADEIERVVRKRK